ncbi:hypothetical protein, partial [Pseudoalteromonas sp. S554]
MDMDMEEPIISHDMQLKKQFTELSNLKKQRAAVLANIRILQKEKADKEGLTRQSLSDEQLYYLISLALNEPAPATKILRACANEFQQDESWCNKVIRFSPLNEQVTRVFHKLEADSNPQLIGLLKNRLFSKQRLLACSDYRSFLNLLKKWLQLLAMVTQKDADLESLHLLNVELKEELNRKSSCLLMIKQGEPKTHAALLKKEIPSMTYKAISKAVGLSRQTVAKHIDKA